MVQNRFFSAEGDVTSEYTELYSPELKFVLGRRYKEKNGATTAIQYRSIKPLDLKAPL